MKKIIEVTKFFCDLLSPFISDASNLVTQIYIFETKFGSSTSNRIQ